MSLLEVHNISHQYGDKILYKNASFELFKRRTYGPRRTKRRRQEHTSKNF